MNMISTGAFLSEMDASNKQPTVVDKFAAVWEKKNAKAAQAGGVSLMALSLAACGSSSTTTTTSSSTTTTTTTTDAATNTMLTAGIDSPTGGSGDDTFQTDADLELSVDDTITGGAGTDTLFIRQLETNTGDFTMTGVEVVDVRAADSGDTDIVSMKGASGYTTLYDNMSADDVTFSSISGTGLTFKVKNAEASTTTSFDYTAKTLTGTADSATLDAAGVTAAANVSINDTGASSALETLVITASAANTAAITLQDDAAAATTLDFNAANAVLVEGDNTATTIDASGSTGDVTVEFGTVAAARTITGGSGNDTFIEHTAGDLVTKTTIDAGAGTADVLQLAAVGGTILTTGTSGNVTNVSGIEVLRLEKELSSAVAIDVSKMSSLTTIDFDDYNDTGADTHAITKMNDGMTVILGDADGDADAATDTDAQLSLGFAANSSTNNVTLQMENVQILKVNSSDNFLDTITIHSKTGANIIEDASTLTAKKIVVTGDQNLDMNTSNALATTVNTVDASAFTGILEITASTTGTEITGGTKADVITGGSGADILTGGAGNDTITGAAGNDTAFGGDDDDEYVFTTGLDTFTGGAGNDVVDINPIATAAQTTTLLTVKDFDAGTSSTTVDQIEIDISVVELLEDDGGLDTALGEMVDGNAVQVTTGDAVLQLVSTDGTALLTTTDVVLLDIGTHADDSDIEAAFAAGSLSFTLTEVDDLEGIFIMYKNEDGGANLAVAQFDGTVTTSDSVQQVQTLAIFEGLTDFTLLNAGDIEFV